MMVHQMVHYLELVMGFVLVVDLDKLLVLELGVDLVTHLEYLKEYLLEHVRELVLAQLMVQLMEQLMVL